MRTLQALAVAAALAGCGKNGPGGPPVPAGGYTCTSDEQCVVACDSPGDCCGPLCGCYEVRHVDEAAAIRARNRASCPGRPGCPVASCTAPTQTAAARCKAGRCAVVLTPIATAPPEPPEQRPPTEVTQDDGFWTTPGAPPASRCEADGDCIGDTAPAFDLCCNNATGGMRAYARAYFRWINEVYRPSHCGGHECPPPPPPPPPRECEIAVKCVDSYCRNSCGQ